VVAIHALLLFLNGYAFRTSVATYADDFETEVSCSRCLGSSNEYVQT